MPTWFFMHVATRISVVNVLPNLDDILKAFEVLDADNLIPQIFCEASDLLRLPPLSLDPIGEQVHANSEVLVTLKLSIASLELKIGIVSSSHISLQQLVVILTIIVLEMFLRNSSSSPTHMLRLLPWFLPHLLLLSLLLSGSLCLITEILM